MKIIKVLTEMIEDELEGAEHYAEKAISYKEEHPQLANTLYEISTQEMRHVNLLHEEVVAFIKKHRETNGEPPAAMMEIYEWMHTRQIEKAKEIKILQNQFRDGI
jgi:hypothetical protein